MTKTKLKDVESFLPPKRTELLPGGVENANYRYEYKTLDKDLEEWSRMVAEYWENERPHQHLTWDQRELLKLLN